ncbi:MAG TPA: fused MFS/spermidine synthase, partial [Sumerlaeia bacterium]|nr:fused MFS/spermidine synthase [Sumerlaeia bacterium]
RLGVNGTIAVGAILSVVAGLGATLLSLKGERPATLGAIRDPIRGGDETPPPTDSEVGGIRTAEAEGLPRADAVGGADAETPLWLARVVLATYGVSGFVALAYQVFWTRTLVFRFEYLKNTTYSFSAMLTVFLIGLAAGSAVMAVRIDRQRNLARLYGLIQILTGLSGAFSLFMLIRYVRLFSLGDPLDPETFDFNWALAVANVFLRTVATIGLPTFLMGMAFPVAARICVRHLRSIGSGTGKLYALNTVGAILGSFAAGFVLIPVFGLARGLLALGLVNVALGLVVLLANPAETPKRRSAWVALAAVAFALFYFRLPEAYCFQELPEKHKLIAYREGPLATVSVAESSIGDRTIYVDNVGVAGTDRILLTDQKSLAHVPMLILENPRRVLTVGFGSGGASYSYLLYPELERVDCVEICRTVPEFADVLKESNHGVLDEWRGGDIAQRAFHDGRYRIIIDDVRSYLRFTNERYDIIATDCTDLRYKSNANLYDLEYFALCRQALAEGGMVVVWMPLGGLSPDLFASALKTFAEVFPEMTIWYMHNEPTHYLLLLGTTEPLRISVSRMLERIRRPAVRKDLADVSLHQPEKILACFLAPAAAFQDVFEPLPVNTENHPILEFESPKYGYSDQPVIVNLAFLRRRQAPVVACLAEVADQPDFIQRLRRFESAVDPILEGHAHIRQAEPQVVEAARAYLRALEINPADESVRFLLAFHDLRRRIEREPNDLWALASLADIEFMQGDCASAANRFHKVMALTERSPKDPALGFYKRGVLGLARCYGELGQPQKALDVLDEAGSAAGRRADLAESGDFQELRRELGRLIAK